MSATSSFTRAPPGYIDDDAIDRDALTHALAQYHGVLSADAASDERFEMSQSIADFRIRSVMCAPLINSDGRVLGVLQVDTLNQRHRYQPADLEVLASVAAQAANAIDNAQLHERAVQQRALERDLELAQQVQQSFLPQTRPEPPGYQFFDFYQAGFTHTRNGQWQQKKCRHHAGEYCQRDHDAPSFHIG